MSGTKGAYRATVAARSRRLNRRAEERHHQRDLLTVYRRVKAVHQY